MHEIHLLFRMQWFDDGVVLVEGFVGKSVRLGSGVMIPKIRAVKRDFLANYDCNWVKSIFLKENFCSEGTTLSLIDLNRETLVSTC